jgi:serine/threonine-protein kinase
VLGEGRYVSYRHGVTDALGGRSMLPEWDALVRCLGLSEVDGYKYVQKLGQGGQGVACLYKNEAGEHVVIKLLIAPRGKEELERFTREARKLKDLRRYHGFDWIVRGITESRQLPGLPVHYFVMERAPGVSLESLIQRNPPPWNWRDAFAMVRRIANALVSAHVALIVHRDLHPGNLMIDDSRVQEERDGVQVDPGVRILDLGVYRQAPLFSWLEPEGADDATFRPVGAVSHASPEALRDPRSVDDKSDIWALGVILYRLMTGAYPFREETLIGLMEVTATGKYTPPNVLEATPEEVDMVREILAHLLQPDPRKRASAGDVARMIVDALKNDLVARCHNTWFRELYFRHRGDVVMCPYCRELSHPFGSRCGRCGHHNNDFLHWSGYFSASASP